VSVSEVFDASHGLAGELREDHPHPASTMARSYQQPVEAGAVRLQRGGASDPEELLSRR